VLPTERVSSHQSDFDGFSQFIDELKLIDLPLYARQITWSNKREFPSFAKLDTFLISEWDNKIPFTLQKGLTVNCLITVQLCCSQILKRIDTGFSNLRRFDY